MSANECFLSKHMYVLVSVHIYCMYVYGILEWVRIHYYVCMYVLR